MRTIQSAMTLTLLAFVVTGCLPNTVAQSSDVEEIKRRLAVIEQATISSQSDQSLDKRLESQSARLADMQAEIAALRVELQRLSGVNEDAAHQRNQLHELLTMIRSEQELKNAHFEERLTTKTVMAPVVVPVPQEQANADARAQYEAALILIQKESRFSEGRKALQQFLKDHPQHELTVNAIYWIGEAYYGEKQYEKAILQFQDVIQKFSKHAKAPAAMLKQGLAFGALGEKATEQALLKKVVAQYPKSPEAKKAKELIK
jgi:tol-pal system protein YbgF